MIVMMEAALRPPFPDFFADTQAAFGTYIFLPFFSSYQDG